MRRTMCLRLAVVGLVVILLAAGGALAQVRHEIRIPDIAGYVTLKCDFHMHTVFSDGNVWPTVRVDEAWREGLDAISITDHIEYQPHKNDIPTNHNRPYDIALPAAKDKGILLIRGTEITRDTPPGHFNALFLEDINPLDTKDLLDCMAAADKQGAFIWWNHPDWKPEHIGWFDIHTTLYEKKYMRGIEVVNGDTYSTNAHNWALEKDLTFMANSDIHAPSLVEVSTAEKHRPMTLVFAKEKTIPAVKEALEAGRTAIWFEDKIIGCREYLELLFVAAVRITDIQREGKAVRFTIRNGSVVPMDLEKAEGPGPKNVTLPPDSLLRVRLNASGPEETLKLSYVAKNFLVAPGTGLPVSFTIAGAMKVEIGVGMGQW
ncbi:MAG TPA: Sb-PDE family phosphodiesterase [Sedimentisphaerales bacterium]|nr:Sb-PDE family phosphodiesterase [Sedimentisphaerales bacterium]HNU28978.1 Sb-PDE family phosphodiesterase [Sedimentisphaerales bacterium]